MCEYVYTLDYSGKPPAIGRRCPYPELFAEIRSDASNAGGAEHWPVLPLDGSGLCLFHSRNVEWKRLSGFAGTFLRLVRALDSFWKGKVFDFAEFVFVGDESKTAGGSDEHRLYIADVDFCRQACFTGASFLDRVEFERVRFPGGADFDQTVFADGLRTRDVTFGGLDLSRAKLEGDVAFRHVEFLNYALFGKAEFTGAAEGYAVIFEDSVFDGMADFSEAEFALGSKSSLGFLRVQFDGVVDFTQAKFNCHVDFREAVFASTTEFIDSVFGTTVSSARYAGAALEFKRIVLSAGAALIFVSSDSQRRMFNQDVLMSFKGDEDPAGTIRFENVNFSWITPASRQNLIRLAKLGKVEIGSGCIKYRFQTEVRSIAVSPDMAQLVLELCQTFSNYFTVSSGYNLGFEVVSRDSTTVRFFYFTDEDISEGEFYERLEVTEQDLWNLLALGTTQHSVDLPKHVGTHLSVRKESLAVNAVDGVSALLGTFFRVGVRIAAGAWKERDTKSLLGAIRFNDEGAESRAAILHRVLVEKYTREALLRISGELNAPLPLMSASTGSERAGVDVAIITVIDIERIAVCEALGLDSKDRVWKEGRAYWKGSLAVDGVDAYDIVVVQASDMANVDAALVTAAALRQWKPSAVLLVGIAAAVDGNQELGDVVVATDVYYFERGKVRSDGIKPEPYMIPADMVLLNHATALPPWTGPSGLSRPDGGLRPPQVARGVVASGERVIADAGTRDAIILGQRKILAIEMEGYGVSKAVHQSFERVRLLVIRGLCDKGDENKDDRWHAFAAATAADYMRHFLLDRPVEPRGSKVMA